MRHDDDRYFDDEEDNDLWDDELELTTDDRPERRDASHQTYTPDTSYYTPHDADEPDSRPGDEPDYYSDPEPAEPVKPRRESLFGSREEDDQEEGNDYYDSDADPAPTVKKPKTPKLDPEDPDYWIEEESPLSGIMPPTGKKWKWKLAAYIACLLVILGGWIWFLRPHADGAVKYGYLINMERRGSIIKTFEGTMIPYKELGDPDPFYFQQLHFSVAGDSLAALMKRMMLGCVPVRVEYEIYHTPLPWKGEQKMVIVKADTADPRKILPPEYRR